MNKSVVLLLIGAQCLLLACSPIKIPVTNQYKLEAFSSKALTNDGTRQSILVTVPEAMGSYQTEQMLYIKKPFEISVFANNAWINPPADMLYPLIVQSLQQTGYFYAIASGNQAEHTTYRLDTQLLELDQNFLSKPSTVNFVAKVVLTRVNDNHVIASRLISQHISCPMETPYGGVISANRATANFTAEVSNFVVTQVKRDRRSALSQKVG